MKRTRSGKNEVAVNQIEYFEALDHKLLRHILVEYVDCSSLCALAQTSSKMHHLIHGKGGIADELLLRISPLMEFSQCNLHTIYFYEQIKNAKREFKVSCGDEHTVVVARSQIQMVDEEAEDVVSSPTERILTFGNNEKGQLGNGTLDNTEKPTEVVIPDLFQPGVRVKSIVGGGNHTLAVLTNGMLYGWGSNEAGQLGPFVTENVNNCPVVLKFPKIPIQMMSCAENYSAILLADKQGTVIIMGNGLQCDLEPFTAPGFPACSNGLCFYKLPRGDLLPHERVFEISAGHHHLLMITANGRPLAIGSDSHGQLGRGIADREGFASVPTPVRFDWMSEPVAQVAAGERHSMLLTRDGELFTFGAGESGQLGTGDFISRCEHPRRLSLPDNCFPIIITCGVKHSVVLDIEGRIITFGSNVLGQVASSGPFFCVPKPQVVNTGVFKSEPQGWFRKLSHIAAGKNHTAVWGDHDLVMFGQEKFCGVKGVGKISPTIVKMDKAKVVDSKKIIPDNNGVYLSVRYRGNVFSQRNYLSIYDL